MATISIAENVVNSSGGTLATHTFTIKRAQVTLSEGSPLFSNSTGMPTVQVKYNTSANGRNFLQDSIIVRGSITDASGVGHTWGNFWSKGHEANSALWNLNANTNATMTRSGTVEKIAINVDALFTDSNPTVRTIPIKYRVEGNTNMTGWITTGKGPDTYGGYEIIGYRGGSYTSSWVTEGSIVLDAPPTFDTTQVAFDTPYVYAGYTNARVTVSNLSAKYGGNISSAVLTIGSQTASRADNGDLVIALENGGTFTPTVKVTDSRGQITTQTLNPITVNVYVAPTVSFSIERTDSVGVINDEGESALVTAKFNWTDEIASLSAPTIVCKDSDGITVSATATWYSDRALTTPITDWSQVAEDVDIYCLLDNANHDAFGTQDSYQIAITPTDSKSDGMAITQTLATAFYTIDFLAGGHGIAFGQPSSQEGFFCNMDAYFKDKTNLVRALFDFMYPVGSYYETSDMDFNPNNTWGGTWILETEGIVHVSAGSNYAITHASDNDGAGTKDGGETTVTLTSAQSAMPSHHHGMNNHTHSLNNHAHSVGRALGVSAGSWAGDSASALGGSGHKYAYVADSTSNAVQTITATGGNNGNTGGNTGNTTDASVATAAQAHTNMQPYIVVNRWHRTA